MPAEIIRHGVWLYYWKWYRTFGRQYANPRRYRRHQPGDTWQLDEVFRTIHGEQHYRWHAVEQDGNVLDILVQRRRNKQAAQQCFRTLRKGCQDVPRVIITDKLREAGLPPSPLNEAHRWTHFFI